MRALLFPGQGVQRTGMGAELFADHSVLCDDASNALGYDLVSVCLDSSGTQLRRTEYAQPAIVFVNALAHLEARGAGRDSDYYAGHSLGEFNALVAAGAIDLISCLKLVSLRGKAMSCIEDGGMLAVFGLTREAVSEVLGECGFAAVYIANHNSDEQIVLAGERTMLKQCARLLPTAGATKAVPLNVSGPFHSPLMAQAQRTFGRHLAEIEFGPLTKPVVSSVTGTSVEVSEIRRILRDQISAPVEWVAAVRRLRQCGVTSFDEVNGSTLMRLSEHISAN
ncbi:ACP S-malonyltransferase [Trinickia sp. NRRL B-1857]|uniref:ACP S-malonyltransferase n=1 Tax=Trinickia sp. NRRL B-1857 TaxID=3162879 RepID=UPI003D2A5A32